MGVEVLIDFYRTGEDGSAAGSRDVLRSVPAGSPHLAIGCGPPNKPYKQVQTNPLLSTMDRLGGRTSGHR